MPCSSSATAGPVGYPGSAEVVNMLPPDRLVQAGISELPCIGDGRQSGTSASPSILNASPEATVGGGLAFLKTGDRVRIDLNTYTANVLVSDRELAQRKKDWKQLNAYLRQLLTKIWIGQHVHQPTAAPLSRI